MLNFLNFFSSSKKDAHAMQFHDGSHAEMHGHKGKKDWVAPKLAAECDQTNREDSRQNIKAHEYLDDSTVLDEKVELMAQFIKQAKCCTAYTGAGLSRAAGIGDYASKAKNSLSGGQTKKLNSPLDAQPTLSHKVLVALEKANLLHQYVQQNHDGIPQKAGFPQEKINEIHGAWYDPSNRVVQFDESLRHDLYEWMVQIEQETDLCLCLGTSLSGMRADDVPKSTAKKSFPKNNSGTSTTIGTIIINLQKTNLDSKACLRIWAPLDEVFGLLAKKLDLKMEEPNIKLPMTKEYLKFPIPYNKKGQFDNSSGKKMIWDLNPGKKVIVLNPEAKNYKETGEIIGLRADGHINVGIGKSRFPFGSWWISCAMEGKWPFYLPFVNIDPEFVDDVDDESSLVENQPLLIEQTYELIGNGIFSWGLSLSNIPDSIKVRKVIWRFGDKKLSTKNSPFLFSLDSPADSEVNVKIILEDGKIIKTTHTTRFTLTNTTVVPCV